MTVVFHQGPPSSTIMTCFLPFVLWPQGTVIFGAWGFFVYMTQLMRCSTALRLCSILQGHSSRRRWSGMHYVHETNEVQVRTHICFEVNKLNDNRLPTIDY